MAFTDVCDNCVLETHDYELQIALTLLTGISYCGVNNIYLNYSKTWSSRDSMITKFCGHRQPADVDCVISSTLVTLNYTQSVSQSPCPLAA